MDEAPIRLHIEPLDRSGFIATSTDVPGLFAEGGSFIEATEIAQGLARKALESCHVYGDDVPPASIVTDRAAQHDHYLYGHPKRP